jgi:hypothetical protein
MQPEAPGERCRRRRAAWLELPRAAQHALRGVVPPLAQLLPAEGQQHLWLVGGLAVCLLEGLEGPREIAVAQAADTPLQKQPPALGELHHFARIVVGHGLGAPRSLGLI